MLSALKALISANLLRILAALAGAVAVGAVLLGARQSGKSAEIADQLARQAKLTRRARGIEDENKRTLADGDAAARLRADWERKAK